METKTIYIYELGKNQQEKTLWKSPIYARERKNPYEREKKERKERKEKKTYITTEREENHSHILTPPSPQQMSALSAHRPETSQKKR